MARREARDDQALGEVSSQTQLRAGLLDPLGQIFEVSDKVVSMTLATLLLVAARSYELNQS